MPLLPATPARPEGGADRFAVSVIMPTFNRAHLIGESIISALGQTHAPAEIIVIDDGSTDETAEIVEQFSDRVTYLRQENAGKSAALNRGIAAASGDGLLVLDDDDLLPRGALAAHVAALVSAPDAGFSFGRFARFSGRGEAAHRSNDLEPLPPPGEKRLLVQLMQCCFLPNPAWMVRRESQLAAGPYRTDLPRGQDYEMILRLARAAPGAYAGGVTLYQRKHVAQRTTSAGKVMATDTVAGWIAAERQIFSEIDAQWSDSDFLPFPGSLPPREAERLAVLQRAVILFMRKLHDRAAWHFARYASLLGEAAPGPRELAVAGDLLGARYGIGELADGSHDPALLGANRLPLALRQAMARQLPWRLRELVGAGRIAEAARLVDWGRRALGGAALLGAGGARLADHARGRRTRSRISAS
jgi:glycosyltransferase involved in cell wall biosynthesis